MSLPFLPNKNKQAGLFLVLVLVLGAIFVSILTAFIGYITTQSQVITQRYILDQSAEVAEAGINYFKWYLHHNTSDISSALPSGGATTTPYQDINGDRIGEFELSIATTTYCGAIASIDVSSTGRIDTDPTLERTVSARFMRPTVADYSYILDADFVWAGDDREIYGPYHSNGQIRMDGTNYSTVSSEITTQDGNDGVYTTTANADTSLFLFPQLEIPFAGFVNDLDEIETSALNNGGYHRNNSGSYGYLVQFIGGNQMRVTEVTNTYNYRGYTSENGWAYERNIVRSTGSSETWTINSDCPVAFFDDTIWIEAVDDGDADSDHELDAMLAVVSTESIILEGDIEFEDADTDGLLAIAEDDVLVGVTVPDDMTVNGIFMAQTGRFGRNHYRYSDLPNPSGPADYRPYYDRNSLTINGTIVSKNRVGTQWSSGGTFLSGFRNRFNYYNRNLVDNPPPLVPNTSSNYDLVDWREAD